MGITITPEIWGPSGWKFMHFIALSYPEKPTEEQKIHYRTFFDSIKNILPCIICSNNYKKHLEDFPLSDKVLKDKESLVHWTIDMHNLVNVDNGKKALSYEEAIDLMLNNFNDNIINIQNNEVPSYKNNTQNKYKRNIEYKNVELKQKERINFIEYQDSDNNSIFYSFLFWFVILGILITIAIVYKKN
jgi:hypothetical protein